MQNSGQPDFHTHVQSPDSRAGTWDLPGLYCPSEPSSGLTCEVGFNLEGFFFYREAERAWKHCRSSKAVSLKKLVKTSLALAKQTKQGEKQAKTNHTKPRTEVCFFFARRRRRISGILAVLNQERVIKSNTRGTANRKKSSAQSTLTWSFHSLCMK